MTKHQSFKGLFTQPAADVLPDVFDLNVIEGFFANGSAGKRDEAISALNTANDITPVNLDDQVPLNLDDQVPPNLNDTVEFLSGGCCQQHTEAQTLDGGEAKPEWASNGGSQPIADDEITDGDGAKLDWSGNGGKGPLKKALEEEATGETTGSTTGGTTDTTTVSPSVADGSYDISVSFVGAWTDTLKQAFQAGVDLIESFIVSGLPDYNGVDDLEITAEIGYANGYWGYAYSTATRPGGLASEGTVILEENKIATMEQYGMVDDFAVHEILHVMGFSGSVFGPAGLLETFSDGSYRFTGANAIEAYNTGEYAAIAADDPLSLYGVPVQGSGSHWDEGIFTSEIITPTVSINNVVSDMTIAAMEDLGYQTTYGLTGGAGNDTVTSDPDADELVGTQGADTLNGGAGQDTILGGAGDDVLEGGAGNDSIDGEIDNDSVFGNEGDDVINGGNGADSLRGGVGNDTLEGGFGNDTIFGDEDNDVMTAIGGVNLMFGGSGDDRITGAAANDTLNGGDGADTLDGGNSTDVFLVDNLDIVTDTGASGFDNAQILSQAGDSIDMSTWSGVERVNGNIGNDTIDASSQSVVLTLTGNSGDDLLIGGSAGDFLIGGDDNDTLIGGEGNNWFVGGTGNDEMTGGSGDEIFFIGQNGDTITDAGDGYDRAVLNELNLSIMVGSWTGVERVVGFDGNDTIDATGGATGITLTGGAGADELTGTDFDDVFLGGSGADIITGSGGNDTIDGGADADWLTGGAGNDKLIGKSGADSFVFDDGFGQDVVVDYLDGTDRLDFRQHSGVNAISDLQINQSGNDAVITLTAGGTDQVTLSNVLANSLTAGDFDFV